MKPLGRPKKSRKIEKIPEIKQFSPRGKPGRPNEIQLAVDHFEAIRLGDFKGLKQAQAAQEMGVSRQTFGRILKEARSRVATGLVIGKIIRIEGGKIILSSAGKSGKNTREILSNSRKNAP